MIEMCLVKKKHLYYLTSYKLVIYFFLYLNNCTSCL